MIRATRARYTLEFKQEAVRLVESGQSISAASRTLGLVEQTLFNWVKALQIARRRHLSAEALLVHIRAVYAANRGAYGWPRIWREILFHITCQRRDMRSSCVWTSH